MEKDHPINHLSQEDIDKEIQDHHPSIIKKFLVILIGIFLFILIFSYFVVSPSNLAKITGFLQSYKLDKDTVNVDHNTILRFNNLSLVRLNQLYEDNLNQEFKVCLKGEKQENTYIITETIQPKTYLQEFNRVISEPCTSEHIVALHTHPFRQCLPSEQDLNNFKRFKQKNKDALMAIMCEKDRFNFYK